MEKEVRSEQLTEKYQNASLEKLVTEYHKNNSYILENYKKLSNEIAEETRKVWEKFLYEKRPHKVIGGELNYLIKIKDYLLKVQDHDTLKLAVMNTEGKYIDNLIVSFRNTKDEDFFVDLKYVKSFANDNLIKAKTIDLYLDLCYRRRMLKFSKEFYEDMDSSLQERKKEMAERFEEWIKEQIFVKKEMEKFNEELN